jgi:hypothetical protein
VPTYSILAKVSDLSDSVFINFYKELGDNVMDMKADEFMNTKENDSALFNELL